MLNLNKKDDGTDDLCNVGGYHLHTHMVYSVSGSARINCNMFMQLTKSFRKFSEIVVFPSPFHLYAVSKSHKSYPHRQILKKMKERAKFLNQKNKDHSFSIKVRLLKWTVSF